MLRNTIPSPALSTFKAHQTAFPRQNDFFCRQVKRDASAEGISVERLVLQGLSLTVYLNAPLRTDFLATRLLLNKVPTATIKVTQ